MPLMCWMKTKETSYRCLGSLSSFFLISITGNFTCEHLKKIAVSARCLSSAVKSKLKARQESS